jgi:hypothetical protein
MHPILIDTIRRVYEKNLEVEKWRKSHDYSDKEADKKIAESIKTDEAVGSVMEWTGALCCGFIVPRLREFSANLWLFYLQALVSSPMQ